MPITRKEFEEAKDELGEKALQFLVTHPTEAFTAGEIAKAIGLDLSFKELHHSGEQLRALHWSLSYLAGLGKVERKDTGGGPYFMSPHPDRYYPQEEAPGGSNLVIAWGWARARLRAIMRENAAASSGQGPRGVRPGPPPGGRGDGLHPVHLPGLQGIPPR